MADRDIQLEDHGSLWLLRPMSEDGTTWLDQNIGDEARMLGAAVVVEPRYVEDITEGMINDGLIVAGPGA
tara:strand:- start:287 stop:496 length:210 start_codon:yes stop_codon:yes gene_type:complete